MQHPLGLFFKFWKEVYICHILSLLAQVNLIWMVSANWSREYVQIFLSSEWDTAFQSYGDRWLRLQSVLRIHETLSPDRVSLPMLENPQNFQLLYTHHLQKFWLTTVQSFDRCNRTGIPMHPDIFVVGQISSLLTVSLYLLLITCELRSNISQFLYSFVLLN